MEITYSAIGVVHSPFHDVDNMPIQPSGASGIRGSIEVYPTFAAGLQDLDGFSHILVLYHLHLAWQPRLVGTPFLDEKPHGVFATRAPWRPNPIGFLVLRLVLVRSNTLEVENLDIVDGTPLLDIKPYAPEFDHYEVERTGWLVSAAGECPARSPTHVSGSHPYQ